MRYWLQALLILAGAGAQAQAPVVVNQVEIESAQLQALAGRYGYQIAPGRYWYDTMTGAWGLEGSGTRGFIAAGLGLGGPLRADASGGRSGVFVNGRELADSDIQAFQALGIPVQTGRWWLDAQGNGGIEGGPVSFNLYWIAQQARASGRESIYSSWGSGDNKTSTWIGSDGSLSHSTTINGKTYDYYIGD